MPDDEPRNTEPEQQITPERYAGDTIQYREVARGGWGDLASQVPSEVAAVLERIGPEIAAARDLKEVRDLTRSIAGVGGLERLTGALLRDSLVDRSGGVRFGVPTERGTTGAGSSSGPLGKIPGGSQGSGGRARYEPSTGLRTGGLASQGGGPVNVGGQVGGAWGSISHGSDGSVVVTRNERYENGTTVTTVVVYNGGRVTSTGWEITNPDGSSSSGGTVNLDDGGQVEYQKDVDAEGNVTSERHERRDAEGNPVQDEDVTGQPGIDGEGHDSDLARYFRAWHAGVYGPDVIEFSVPALVNPGTPENADAAQAPTRGIDLGDDIVINPDPERTAGPGGMSAEVADRLKEQLEGGGTPGPNPGPRPGGD